MPPPIGLMARLFGERVQHGDGAGPALHGDQQTGGDQVAERVVDLVGETAEHDVGVLSAEAGGEPAHLRADRRPAGRHRRVDRADRLIAGDQHVT